MTAGATGEKTNKQKTDGEEARGGERDARAGKVAEGMELGQGNLWGGGGRRGGHSHQWTITHNSKYRLEYSVWGAAVRDWSLTPPYYARD